MIGEGQKTEDYEDNADKSKKKNAKKETVKKSQTNGTTEDGSNVSVKGLSNLGNTCFFNAVIQVRVHFALFLVLHL